MSRLLSFIIVLWATLGLATLAQAATDATEAQAAVTPVGADTLLSVLLGLLGIIALILGLAWFARRAGATGWARSNDMKVVATLALGTRERLLVVDVAGTQILLGVTAQAINQLHVFEQPVIAADGTQSSEFSQKLMSIMKAKPTAFSPPGTDSGDAHANRETQDGR
ncbi:flagellar biosynthetic protein FliO [Gilvimarinus agarilyticus]|uniref:flagellar biosynthetic protein FliO n=1 Tax=Gilvimarinus agarilyticus TaxID=679259 RepID=UPI000696E2BD|nr:flagellar biosynthetic protein FliO [Gilvimarinus agarilyticus]